MAFWSDDIVMHAAGNNPHSGTYRGKAEVRCNLIDRIYRSAAGGRLAVDAMTHRRSSDDEPGREPRDRARSVAAD
jgi:hypothetical protein